MQPVQVKARYQEDLETRLMNSALVGYEELRRSRRVLSTADDNTLSSICLILRILLRLIH